MTQTDDAPKRRGWLKAVLVLSLAFNLLILGVAAGWLVSSGGERPDRATRNASNFVGPQFFRALEPGDRRALVRDMVRQRDRLRENRGALRDRIERLLAALDADTFDVDAVRDILAEQRSAVAARHQIGEELLLSRLSEMTLDERQRYAKRLSESLKKARSD